MIWGDDPPETPRWLKASFLRHGALALAAGAAGLGYVPGSVRRARARRLPSCMAWTRAIGIARPSSISSALSDCGPGTPVSFPVPWDELDRVAPADFTVRTAPPLLAGSAPWAGQLPGPQSLSAELVEEGRAIPIARVQAMHEGKRRARARRTPDS